MTVTVEQPPLQRPDAGVIEEARARQRRHRGIAAAAVASAAIGLAFFGGGGSRSGSASTPRAQSPPPQSARSTLSSCPSASKTLQGAPSKSLLSILGVLRRPASAADRSGGIEASSLVRHAFVHYIRLTRVVSGSPYHIYPAIVGGCGPDDELREGMMGLATNLDLGHGIIGGEGGGGEDAAEIERGEDAETGSPGSPTSATITMLVPDGVATVTLHYPAGRASGYSPKVSPPVTITTAPVNNELVVRVPRSAGGGTIRQVTMIWRDADGHVIKTLHKI